MKHKFKFLLVLLLAISCRLAAQPTVKGYMQNDIKDMALIYQGGTNRLDWTKDQFLPYVRHQFADGRKEWLFDGFLFLEYADGKGHAYAFHSEKENARQEEWKWLLDRLFEKGKSLSALNECISEQKKILGNPSFRHRIVIGLPEPAPNQKDWGVLNKKKADFAKNADRIAAIKWYINEVKTRFAKAGLNNLELAGFYWVSEDVATSREITTAIGNYIRTLKEKFFWIPYWNATGYSDWKALGFDYAYFQPNHFFQEYILDERINNTCKLAAAHNMGLELEFDDRALADNKPSYRYRLVNYIDRFEKEGVFSNSSIAYYAGGATILKFAESNNKLDKEIMDRLATIICNRHAAKKQQQPYKDKMLEYGRLDVSMNILPVNGSNVTIKLSTTDKSYPGSIIVMQYDSKKPNYITGGVETQAFNAKTGNIKLTNLAVDHLCGVNHIFSCERTNYQIKLYVDGVMFYEMDNDFGENKKEWPFIGTMRLSVNASSTSNGSELYKLNSVDFH